MTKIFTSSRTDSTPRQSTIRGITQSLQLTKYIADLGSEVQVRKRRRRPDTPCAVSPAKFSSLGLISSLKIIGRYKSQSTSSEIENAESRQRIPVCRILRRRVALIVRLESVAVLVGLSLICLHARTSE